MKRLAALSIAGSLVLAFVPTAQAVPVNQSFQVGESDCTVTVVRVTRAYHPRYRNLHVRVAVACTGEDAEKFPYGIVQANAMRRDRGGQERDISPGTAGRLVLGCNWRKTAQDDWRRQVRPVWIDLFTQVLDGQNYNEASTARTTKLAISC